jgi:hypothetical protein
MKAITKNIIRLAIVAVLVLSFTGPTTVSAEETLLLASIDRSAPADRFDNYDFFPDYHREAKKREADQKERAKEDVVDTLITDAEWVGGAVYTPVSAVTSEFGTVTDKIIVPYEVINGDYVGLIERVLTKYGRDMAEAADSLLSLVM